MTHPDVPDETALTASAHPLRGKHIVVGVGGGIAAYKAVELVRLFTKAGATVQVVMTPSAQEFVGPLTFQALSGNKVMTELFDLTQESEIGHIQLADRADLIVIAPATANLIAKMAAGMASCPVSAVVLASRAKVLLAPSMNVNMWESPLTQANVRPLVEVAKMSVVGPGAGFLACRWVGPGRLAEPVDIVEAAAHLLSPQDFAAKRVVITAGPTFEAVDPVRFLGNRSSGKMGYALARAAARRGAVVELISGPTSLDAPAGVTRQSVESAREMAEATVREASSADIVIMAAAVADFRPEEPAPSKLKKERLGASASISLVRTEDILAALGAKRRGGTRPFLVGFAAETEDLIANARTKLATKGCDLVVANDVSQPDAGFAVDTNRVILVDGSQATELPLLDKDAVAHAILDRIAIRAGDRT